MRTALVLAAALATAAAAPAAGCTACAGHLTAHAGAVTLAGTGEAAAGRGFVARCAYDGGSLTMTLAAASPEAGAPRVEGECVLYTDRVANGVWADDGGAAALATVTATRQVGAGVQARQLCLDATATWDGGADSVWLFRCVDAAAAG